jgi:hypothetical protein
MVYFHEYFVLLLPSSDSRLVITGADADEGFDQSAPVRWPTDLSVQDRI